MKFISICMFLALLLFSFEISPLLVERCDAFTPTPTPKIGWKNFSYSLYGFSFSYPYSNPNGAFVRDPKDFYFDNTIQVPIGNQKVIVGIIFLSKKLVKQWHKPPVDMGDGDSDGDFDIFPYSFSDLKSAIQLQEDSDCKVPPKKKIVSMDGKIITMNGVKAIRLFVGRESTNDLGEKIRYFIFRGQDRWIEVNVTLVDVFDLDYLTGSKKLTPDMKTGMDAADSVLRTMRFN
jgi:hypothetical protein